MTEPKRSLYFPYDEDESPEFIAEPYQSKLGDGCIEYLSVSPSLTLMYQIIDPFAPANPHLVQYGGICTNIPGPAVLIGNDSDGDDADVPEDILDSLEEILVDDIRERIGLTQSIGNIIYASNK